jgi:hypothetical protein
MIVIGTAVPEDNCYNLYLISGESFCSTHGILGFLTKEAQQK